MSTRADFYIGRGEDAEWIGSVAFDGSPDGLGPDSEHSTGGHQALTAGTETDFRGGVAQMGETRDDFTAPERGWPWPWRDSATTDYVYAFEADSQGSGGAVFASHFGGSWWAVDLEQASGGEPDSEDGAAPVFPDMGERMNVRWDEGSGVSVF